MESGQCSICHQASAKFTCSCAIPSISICASCTLAHLESPGPHSPVPAPKPANAHIQGGNEVCDVCTAQSAVSFCPCLVPLKKFCKVCDSAHRQKTPGIDHFPYPIAAYEPVSSGRISVKEFSKKQRFIESFKLHIEEELTRFDAFAKQVEGEFEALLAQITVKKDAIMADLCIKRGQIEANISEIQSIIDAKRYAESFEVFTPLDDYIANGYTLKSDTYMDIFTLELNLQEIEPILDRAVSIKLLEGLFVQIDLDIPILNGNNLRLFNHKTLEMEARELSQPTRIDNGTAYCYIGPTTLLAVGGQYHNEVYEVNIHSGKVNRRANMAVIRAWMGIIYYKNWVYVIGGYNTSSKYLNSAEKYSLEWISLRNPLESAKFCCSICEHTSGLYISGVEQSGSSIECLNPVTETFRLLRSDSVLYPSILCCAGEELYRVRWDTIEAIKLGTAVASAKRVNIPKIGDGRYWLCCPFKLLNGELISVLNNCGEPYGLFSFKPIQGKFTQVANFVY